MMRFAKCARNQLPFEIAFRVDGILAFQISINILRLHFAATTNLVASLQQDLYVVHSVKGSALFKFDEVFGQRLLQLSSHGIVEQGLPGKLLGTPVCFSCRKRLRNSFEHYISPHPGVSSSPLSGFGILT